MNPSDKGLVDGYKFSFQKVDNSAFNTPTFVSVQLPEGSLTAPHLPPEPNNSQTFKQAKTPKKLKPKFYESKIHLTDKGNRPSKNISYEGKRFYDNHSVGNEERKNRRVIHTVTPKTFYYPKKQMDKKQESGQKNTKMNQFFHKKFRIQDDKFLRRSRSQRSSKKSEEQESDSYLRIYKNQKKKKLVLRQKSAKQRILIKNHISVLNFLDIHGNQSPKSTSSARNFNQKKSETSNLLSPTDKQLNSSAMEIINASLFPETAKSIKFQQKSGNKMRVFNNSELNNLNLGQSKEKGSEVNFSSKFTFSKKFFKSKANFNQNDKISGLAAKLQRLKLQALQYHNEFEQ